mgnify:CR=1 FL=1
MSMQDLKRLHALHAREGFWGQCHGRAVTRDVDQLGAGQR